MADSITGIHSIGERADLKGVRVLVRAGLDVPVDDNGTILDDFRVRTAVKTLAFLKEAGARVIVISHTSRPDGSSAASLKPVCEALSAYIPVTFVDEVVGEKVTAAASALKDGELIMLENLRFDDGEKANDEAFARALAALADVYVDDAFSAAHREHASMVSVPKLLPSYAGLLFMDELTHLAAARAPEHPSIFVLGGAKFETKLPLAEKLLSVYDRIFIGGALANDFFKARGLEVGTSLVSDIDISASPLFSSAKVILPVDVVVSTPEGERRVAAPDAVAPHERIQDLGPATVAKFKVEAERAAIILWNGPMGNYEQGFDESTRAFADIVAAARGTTIVGGGDTVASVKDPAVIERFSYLSTAGGAMLAFLEQGTLPGIEALRSAPSAS